ncbi:hypothetical protein K438DRAFT_1829858 [Mycena galopus ATCC 62051]|nr:hypothetical protein K438DRAFT_1829858 [Mycena galopus ATCC 62051]
MSTSTPELPSELWLKVFCLLPFRSHQNIHAVSWLFSDLSCSFLFEEVVFDPKTKPSLGDAEHNRQAIQRQLDRVAFWSSERIAPHVRRCTVVLDPASMSIVLEDPLAPRRSLIPEGPPSFVAGCFEGVSKFKNLRGLWCSVSHSFNIQISTLRVDELSSLKLLHIRGARLVPPTSESTRLKIEDFAYTEIPRLHYKGQTPSPFPYLSFFDPSCLNRLHLESEYMPYIESFLADKLAIASFRHLRVLEIENIPT